MFPSQKHPRLHLLPSPLRDHPENRRWAEGSGMSDLFLGVDVGSVSTNLVLADGTGQVRARAYLHARTRVRIAGRCGVFAGSGMIHKQQLGFPKDVMGALGAALLAREAAGPATRFRGFAEAQLHYGATSFECQDCSNQCEIIEIHRQGQLAARWGGRCGKWDRH
jgi:hypothetical protein